VATDFLFHEFEREIGYAWSAWRRWSVCVGCEDRKMAARLMERSGATLIRDGGKPLVKKARRRKLVEEAGSRDT